MFVPVVMHHFLRGIYAIEDVTAHFGLRMHLHGLHNIRVHPQAQLVRLVRLHQLLAAHLFDVERDALVGETGACLASAQLVLQFVVVEAADQFYLFVFCRFSKLSSFVLDEDPVKWLLICFFGGVQREQRFVRLQVRALGIVIYIWFWGQHWVFRWDAHNLLVLLEREDLVGIVGIQVVGSHEIC